MDEGMMQGGAPRSMRSPGFAARGFLRHEAEFPGSQTSLAADAPAITFQRSKSISNLEVFDKMRTAFMPNLPILGGARTEIAVIDPALLHAGGL